MKSKIFLLLLMPIMLIAGCNESTTVKVTTQDDYPSPPKATAKPDTLREFNNIRIDDYFWIKDRNNPDVMAYLKAENAYFDTVMAHTRDLQERLYKEMRGRIKEDDQTVPVLDNGFYYYSRTEKDKQYPTYCRKKGNVDAPEVIIFDVNKMAEGSEAYIFADYEVWANNAIAAYMFNTTGSYADFKLKFRNLETGEDMRDEIDKIQSFAIAKDNKHVFYVRANESLRPYRVYLHELNSASPDKLIYEEKDDMFNVNVATSKNRNFIYIASTSFTSTEFQYIDAGKPVGEFKIFRPREKDVEYFIE